MTERFLWFHIQRNSYSRLSLWHNWGDERDCDEGNWHAHTRGLPRDVAEVVGTVQQVHWSRRLLRRGLEFHVCTINKSGHSKKSRQTYLRILVIDEKPENYHDKRKKKTLMMWKILIRQIKEEIYMYIYIIYVTNYFLTKRKDVIKEK